MGALELGNWVNNPPTGSGRVEFGIVFEFSQQDAQRSFTKLIFVVEVTFLSQKNITTFGSVGVTIMHVLRESSWLLWAISLTISLIERFLSSIRSIQSCQWLLN